MNCNKAQSLMLDHLYGDLTPRNERALLRHLQECSKCSEEFETHKATASAFAKLDMEEPAAGLTASVAAIAAEDIERQKEERPALGGWYWKPALATAAAATLAVIFVVKFIPTQQAYKEMAASPAPQSMEMAKKVPAPRVADPKVSAPKVAAGRLKEVSQSETSVVIEGESSVEYRASIEVDIENGYYAADYDQFGDDITANNIVIVAPKKRASGLAGGKIADDESRDMAELLRALAPAASAPETLAFKGLDSVSRLDSKDSLKVTIASEEAPTILARIPPPEGAPADKPRAESYELGEMKKEKQAAVGGAAMHGGRKPDLEIPREEQARSNVVFDDREFNEAVMEYGQTTGREEVRRLTAQAKYKLGSTYQEEGECEKALAIYETIPEDHPDFAGLADVYIAMGECYLMLEKFDDAKRILGLLHNKFPEKRELALDRISEVVAAQKALRKASETPAESADDSSAKGNE